MDRNGNAGKLAGHLGGALAQRRKSCGWTQEELAERCEISTSYVARVERGERMPSPPLLEKISSVLGLNVADIWPKGAGSKNMTSASKAGEAVPVYKTGKKTQERQLALARLEKAVEQLTADEIRHLAQLVKKLTRAGQRHRSAGNL